MQTAYAVAHYCTLISNTFCTTTVLVGLFFLILINRPRMRQTLFSGDENRLRAAKFRQQKFKQIAESTMCNHVYPQQRDHSPSLAH